MTKERPILFNGAMVRALLAGKKTQTRRLLKPVVFVPNYGCAVGRVGGAWLHGSPAALGLRERGDHWSCVLEGDTLRELCTQQAYGWGAGSGCPYGVPGDRLWVREAIRLVPGQEPDDGTGRVDSIYAADGTLTVADAWPWRRSYLPSMHCPRGLSRITLEITEVRVERLQDISEADCIAEGIEKTKHDFWSLYGQHSTEGTYSPRSSYRALWQSINGPKIWDANPWVWAVSFKPTSAPAHPA